MSMAGEDHKWTDALLFLGVDGGGTQCRARLCDWLGRRSRRGHGGPANIRLGVDDSMRAVLDATGQCLAEAKLGLDSQPIIACLALAGATEPVELEVVENVPAPVPADDRDDGRPCRVRWSASRRGRRGHHRRHRHGGLGDRLRGGTIAWAVGVSRFPTRAAARGSVARWCAACCGRMTGVRPGPACCAASSSSSTPTPCHRALDGLGQAARVCGARAPRGPACAPGRPGGLRAHAARRGTYRCAGCAARRDRRADGWRWPAACRRASARGSSRETKRHLVPAAADALAGALWLARAEARSAAPDELMRKVIVSMAKECGATPT